MKITFNFLCLFITIFAFSQTKYTIERVKNLPGTAVKKPLIQNNNDVPVIHEELPVLIPKKRNGSFGYVNQKRKFIVQPEYHIAVFFYEDCNLLNSPIPKVRKFGTAEYATVEKNEISYRIDKKGKRVYEFKKSDLGQCVHKDYVQQLFQGYVMNGFYGVIEKARFKDPGDYRQFQIYPQYEYLFILEGDDVANPMIVAAKNDLFGIVDKNNNIVIPFIYEDIKRNFSWKLGKMFEVSKDGKNYYYVDSRNQSY